MKALGWRLPPVLLLLVLGLGLGLALALPLAPTPLSGRLPSLLLAVGAPPLPSPPRFGCLPRHLHGR